MKSRKLPHSGLRLFFSATLLGGLLIGHSTHSWASKIPPESERIAQTLRREIHASKSHSFLALLQKWQDRYGTQAISPLLQVASDSSLDDSDRYAALMGAAKLGGTATTPWVVPYLKDRSWMLRSGALRALTALQNQDSAQSVLPLLRDPALVVRIEAIEAIEKLHPTGSTQALLQAIEAPQNYHAHKAQWVPQRALRALKNLGAREAIPHLRPLLTQANDPDLQAHAIDTLASLLGKSFKPGTSLALKIQSLK